MLLTTLSVLLTAYLVGAIPFSYIAARLVKGTDIRRKGSGNVGVTNLWYSVGKWIVAPVAVLDFAKGLLPVLAARSLGMAPEMQAVVGLAVVAGHNWSPYIGFGGGRGIVAVMGVLALLAPRELAVGASIGVFGGLMWNAPLSVAIGLMVMPLMAVGLGEPAAVFIALIGVLAIVMVKRAFPSRDWEGDGSRLSLVVNRLFLDRDVRDRERWLQRQL